MSDAFNVPTEIADVTVVNTVANPVPVTGTITVTPSGTQDVNIVSSAINVPVDVQNFPAVQTVAISQTGTDNNVDANITNASLAVTGPLTDTELRASPVSVTIPTPVPVTDNGGSLTVDGTVSATQGTSPWVVSGTVIATPSGTQDVNLVSTIPVPVTDNGGSLTVDGTVAVSNFPAVQPVSGTVTANQGTSPWVVSGTVTATPTGTQDVNIVSTISLPVTGPLTDTQLRASPVPVSGTVAISQTGTDNDVNVTGNVTVVQPTGTNLHTVVDNFPAIQPVSGTITANQGTSPWIVQQSFSAPQLDLFGRQRISSPTSIFSAQFLYDKQPLLWDESLTSGGTSTFNAAQACIDLAVTTTNGSRVIRQTKEYFVYEPGRVQLCELTAVFGTATTNCTQRLGMFDDNDGCFFQLNGSTFGVTIRSSVSGAPVNTTVNQSSFNLDKLDGTGTSGVTLDITKTQLFVIEYQWFGVGTVRFGIYVNNAIVYCHQIFHANIDTTVYMKRGSLPVRYEIINTAGTANSVTFKQICCTVISEAGYQPVGTSLAVDTGNTPRSVVGTGSLPLLSIRLKAANNRATLIPANFSILTDGANNFRVQVILNGTLTGAAFNSVNANSVTEFDIAATALTGGTVIHSSYVASTTRDNTLPIESLLKVVANIAGTADILTLYVTNVSALINYYGSLEWQEFV